MTTRECDVVHGHSVDAFSAALRARDLRRLREFPKADLHTHLYLAAYASQIGSLGVLNCCAVVPPASFNGLRAMEDWVHQAFPGFRARPKPESFAVVLRAALARACNDGVTMLEVSMNALHLSQFSGGVREVANIVRNETEHCGDRVQLRLEIGCAREQCPKTFYRMLDLVCAHRVFCGIDLYGDESARRPEEYVPHFRLARSAGLKLKAHVGETGCAPEEVRRTAEILDLDVIQHGAAAAASTDVMAWLRQRGLYVNMCPSSNVVLGYVSTLNKHPIRVLADNGVAVTVNTDFPLVLGYGLSEEFLKIYSAGLFSASELNWIRLRGLRSRTRPF